MHFDSGSTASPTNTEEVLWHLGNGSAHAEARARTRPHGTELRLLMSSPGSDLLTLVWSRLFRSDATPGSELRLHADERREELLRNGWTSVTAKGLPR